MFQCIVADPPWKYGDKLTMKPGSPARSAEHQYNVMEVDEICRLADSGHVCGLSGFGALGDVCPGCENRNRWEIMGHPIADDAILWLWTTDPFLLDCSALKVCRSWGFEPKQLWTWIKGTVQDDTIIGPLGMGHYMRVDTERVVLASRGRATRLVQRHDLRNYSIVLPRGRHSEKPEEFYALVEALSNGPCLELFARKHRPGWTVVGDQLPATP